MVFLFILKMVYCVYSLESPRWGDSNESTQHTFILKKIEKISIFSLLTWRYDWHSLARTTLSRTYFHGSKGIRAIEVLLHFNDYKHFLHETIIQKLLDNRIVILSVSSSPNRKQDYIFSFLIESKTISFLSRWKTRLSFCKSSQP